MSVFARSVLVPYIADMLLSSDIKQLAGDSGFDLCGITTPSLTPDAMERYREWLERGYHADMDWMAESAERRADPRSLMDDVRSIIMLGLNYYQPNSDDVPRDMDWGRIARFARGRDYHKVMAKMVRGFVKRVELAVNKDAVSMPDLAARMKWWVDFGPFLERAYAEKAGLGYFGKNSQLINRRFGSWFFLAEVLTPLELAPDSVWPGDHGRCGSCRRCIDACPAGAIIDDGLIDSNRCLSYLTIEHRSEIPVEFASQMGDMVFGCDICQEVCPHNQKRARPTGCRELTPEHGVGEFLDLNAVLAMENREDFLALTEGTALTRPKLEGLQQNARIVKANRHRNE